MSKYFVDKSYFIAIIMPRDQWHESAVKFGVLGRTSVVTTEEILIEVLNFFSGYGPGLRARVATLIREVLFNPNFEVAVRDESSFLEALSFYESRLDKGYSLTDCISMNICRKMNITEILTHDNHFTQEGFNILL